MLTKVYEFLGSIAGGLLRLFTKLGFALLALKAMILTAFTTLLLATLYKVFGSIINDIFEWVQGYITEVSSEMPTIVFDFIGLGAWFYNHLRIEECLALLFAGLTIRFVLQLCHIKK